MIRQTASTAAANDVPPAAAVAAVLADAQTIDYESAKLALDRVIDPTLSAASRKIARLAEAVEKLAGADTGPDGRLTALRTVLHAPGPWNDSRPFAYDHGDPLGQSIRNKLLPVYLETRRGNCVSMPALMLVLGERLGLDIALACAPLHSFVRYRDEAGRTINLETTSGAHPARDIWYREQMPMSERAVANGTYLRSLPKREAVAHLATTVVDHLLEIGRYADAAAVGDVILRHAPRDVYAMVKLGTACACLIKAEFGRYPSPYLIPPFQRPRFELFQDRNRALFEAADALGWEPTE